MKRLIIISLCLIFFLMAAFIYWQTLDEELNPEYRQSLIEHKARLESPTSTELNNLYYSLGLYAPRNIDPLIFGKKRYDIYQSVLNKNYSNRLFLHDIPEEEWADGLPKLSDFLSRQLKISHKNPNESMQVIYNNAKPIQHFAQKYHFILKRYSHTLERQNTSFLMQKNIMLTLSPEVNSMNVSASIHPSIIKLNQLWLASQLLNTNASQDELSHNLLTHYEHLLKKQESSNDLLEYLVTSANISHTLMIINELYKNKQIKSQVYPIIRQTPLQQKPLFNAILHEQYVQTSDIIQSMDLSYFMHPNQYLNAFHNCLKKTFYQPTNLSPQQFQLFYFKQKNNKSNNAQELCPAKKTTHNNLIEELLNPATAYLPNSFIEYSKFVFLLNARIKLTNIRMQFAPDEKITNDKLAQLATHYDISNPFDSTNQSEDTPIHTAYRKNSQLCFAFDSNKPEDDPCIHL